MKKGLLSLAVVTLGVLAVSAQKPDPVLMTVNGKPVTLSEFEYLYQKNNAQQLSQQPVDEYVSLFVDYKLKVADAEAAGLDKSEAFAQEYEGYCRDLSQPYLTDEAAADSIVRLIYDRKKENVDVSHIMVARPYGAKAYKAAVKELSDIRQGLIDGTLDFGAVADSISIDPQAKRNHGHMGVMSGGVYPYVFEDAAYSTAVGDISPVIETPFGLHIVKVNDRYPSPGEVKVQHILKFTSRLPYEQQAMKKQQIDSIYTLLMGGADFSDIARRESEDPGSARNGGMLDWFGTGRMVPEFEKVAFELSDGETSEPFKTSYGWHIIHRVASKDIDPLETLRPSIEAFISRDERQQIPVKVKTAKLRAKYGASADEAVASEIRGKILSVAALDSAAVARLVADERPIVTLKTGDKGLTVGELFAPLASNFVDLDADRSVELFDRRLDEVIGESACNAERAHLAEENADYRNLLNEYRDGMLLFEISDKNVWSRAKSDSEGVRKFFDANRSKYADWKAPKFKGYVIFFTSDSLMNEAKQMLEKNPIADRTKLVEALRERFGKDVRVERVIAAKGDNQITDAIAFGGQKPEPTGKWIAYFPYMGKVVDQPEEPDDDRARVTTDYQDSLEKEWLKQLHAKYPVKIDRKVFSKYKKQLEKK